MYQLKSGIKQDSARRWALPDRIFFGHGACPVLAGVYLERPPLRGFYAEKITPQSGFSGNHIYVTDGQVTFDYHGYALRASVLRHHTKVWRAICGVHWHCTVDLVAFDLLDTATLNARQMRGPDQYLHNPIPRARGFIAARDHVKSYAQALTKR